MAPSSGPVRDRTSAVVFAASRLTADGVALAGRTAVAATRQVVETTAGLVDAAEGYLGSDAGRRLRRQVAGAVIVGAPLLAELPAFRRSLPGRVLRATAATTLIVKGAEWLRDWEPGSRVLR